VGLRSDIVRRGAVYYFRRRLPTHAHQSLHRSHMVFSLRTTCPVTARRRAARASHAFEERFDMSRSIDDFTEGDLKAVADCGEKHDPSRGATFYEAAPLTPTAAIQKPANRSGKRRRLRGRADVQGTP
jgi:hypothetical protein